MTTATFNAAPYSADTTSFRAWGGGISAGLASTGMVKTADTGQIDWATVTAPVVNTMAGYEVWRFNDALQATAPIFFRLEYGTGSTTTRMGAILTVGKGSNGSGAITGPILAAYTFSGQGVGTSTPVGFYISTADGSQCIVSAGGGQTGTAFFNFVIERSRSSDGAATATGLIVATQAGSTAPLVRVYNYASATMPPTAATFWPVSVPVGGTSGGLAVGGRAPMFPAIVWDGSALWQPRAVLTGAAVDLSVAVPISVPGWGTYLPLGDSSGNLWANGASVSGTRCAIAWF